MRLTTATQVRKKILGMGFENLKIMKPSSCLVFNVEKNGKNYTLKIAKYDGVSNWQYQHLVKEKHFLEEMRGEEGIVDLEGFYDVPIDKDARQVQKIFYPVILARKYLEGEVEGNLNLSEEEKEIVRGTIERSHNKGYSGLDLERRNFCYTPKGKLIYFDGGISKKSLNSKEFNLKKKIDLGKLEILLSN